MKQYYDWLIVGATFTGLGAAYACKNNALIIERSSQLGYEYINCFNLGFDWNFTSDLSQEGLKLKNELIERQILSEDGQVYIPAVAPVLYNRIRQDNIPVLLMTDIICVNKSESGYEVEIYNTSGLSKLKALNILDTTYNCISNHPYKPQILYKSINAILHNKDMQQEINLRYSEEWHEGAAIEIIDTKYGYEKILKLKIQPEDDWVTARNKLHQLWAKRPDSLKDWTIAAVADNFEVKVAQILKNIDSNWDLLPSCGFRNPLESFEAGIKYIREKEASGKKARIKCIPGEEGEV